jgi:hypothetical protein
MIGFLIVVMIFGAVVVFCVALQRRKRSKSGKPLPVPSRPTLPLDVSQLQGHGGRTCDSPATTQQGANKPDAKADTKQPCVVETVIEKDRTQSIQAASLGPGQLDEAIEATRMRQDAPGDSVDAGDETTHSLSPSAAASPAAGAEEVSLEILTKQLDARDAVKTTPETESVIDSATSPPDNPSATKASVAGITPTSATDTEEFSIGAKDESEPKEVIDPALAEADPSRISDVPIGERPVLDTVIPSAALDTETDTRPTTYKPPRPKVGRPKSRDKQNDAPSPAPSDKIKNLPILIKARSHQNTWSFSLLAQRPNDAPFELEVVADKKSIQLLDAGDDWYELAGEDLPNWPRGFVLQSKDLIHQLQWQLTARELHILGCNTKVAGWSSVPRLAIGHKHLVLTKDDRVNEVAAVLREIDCKEVVPLGGEFGAPTGWTIFWPVVPTTAAAPVGSDPLLDLLRPLPNVDISFEDGVRLHGSVWMNDFPPTVRVEGTLTEADSIFFDGQVAQRGTDGVVVAPGMGTPGSHDVSITGRQSRSYTVVEPVLPTDSWEAYNFAAGSICGALVKSTHDAQRAIVTIPRSNPLLIGCVPGEVFACPAQPGHNWTILPPFDPVWALPLHPLRSDSRSVRVINLAMMRPNVPFGSLGLKQKGFDSRQWIQAVRDAARKWLPIASNDRNVYLLWTEYARTARDLWRRGRDHQR